MKIDQRRLNYDDSTGVYIRAQNDNGKWQSIDIACLTKESLLEWLKSDGGDNKLAENMVGILVEHGHLHKPDSRNKEG